MKARSERGLILPLINVGAQRRTEAGTNGMNAFFSPPLSTRKQPAPASIGDDATFRVAWQGVQVNVKKVENIQGETKTTPHEDMNLEVWRIILTDTCDTYAESHIDTAFNLFVHKFKDYYGHVAQPPWHDAVKGNTWWYREDPHTSVATTCCTMPPDRVRSFSDVVDSNAFSQCVDDAGMRVVNVDNGEEEVTLFVPIMRLYY